MVHIRLWWDAKGRSASKYLLAFLLFLIILHHLDEGYIYQNTRGRFFQLFLHSLSSSFFVQIGAGEQPDETTIYCSRGSDRYVCFKAMLYFLLLCGDCERFLSSMSNLSWSHFHAAKFYLQKVKIVVVTTLRIEILLPEKYLSNFFTLPPFLLFWISF